MSDMTSDQPPVQSLNQRILAAFERHVSQSSIRRITMSALAKDLGISTKTLYAEFPSKADLVSTLVNRWAERWRNSQREGLEMGLPPVARMSRMVLLWVEMSNIFSSDCWRELKNHFPDANRTVEKEFQAFFERSKINLSKELRPDLNVDLAMTSLLQMLQHARTGKGFDSTQITLLTALTQVITIWARGSIRPDRLPASLQ